MDLQNPTAKMSKSLDSPQGTIRLLDEPAAITKRIKSAVTDSDNEIRFDPAAKPGVSNLLQILGAVTGQPVDQVAAGFVGAGYGSLKTAVGEAVVEFVRPLQERYTELERDAAEVARILGVGADRAQGIATGVLARVHDGAGLSPAAADVRRRGARRQYEHPDSRRDSELEFDRVAFFSDAVFAIAMTLLVVGIGIPHVRNSQLDQALATNGKRSSASS